MKYCRVNKRGSFTVEAALIIPIILGVTVLFIYIAMFCHDRCYTEYVCQMACIKASYSETDAEAAAKEYIDDNLSKRLMNWDTDVYVSSDDESVEVIVEASAMFFPKTFTHKAKAYKHFCPKY